VASKRVLAALALRLFAWRLYQQGYARVLTVSALDCCMTCRAFRPSRSTVVRPVASGGGKTDITKVGLNSIPEGVVKNNLKGISPQMEKKGWVDAQGRKGKVCSAPVSSCRCCSSLERQRFSI